MSYYRYPVDVDPDAGQTASLQRFASLRPGYVPHPGGPFGALARTIALLAADCLQVVQDVADDLFTTFARDTKGIVPLGAATASVLVEVAAPDTTGGYALRAGTLLSWPGSPAPLDWQLLTDLVVPAGSRTARGTAVARDPGTIGNQLPAGTALDVLDGVLWDAQVTTVAASSGGYDGEVNADFAARAVEVIRLDHAGFITPGDAGRLARIVPGVTRVGAVSGYNPTTGLDRQPRTVCVWPLDPSGLPVGPTVRTALLTLLTSLRETGFLVFSAAPAYVPLTIAATVLVAPGSDPVAVGAAVTARLTQVLTPPGWAGGLDSPPTLTVTDTVGYLDLAHTAANVAGVLRVATLTIDGTTADVSLRAKALAAGLDPHLVLPAGTDPRPGTWTAPTTVTVTATVADGP